ncbi:MAG: PGN_0703 family putative restriction endonuclease [Polyangiales bacterium]
MTGAGSPSCDVGPQYANDAPFTARMRLHQSWWRASELSVPYGRGPTPRNLSRYGSMLDASSGAAGSNFLTPEIFAVVEQRIALGGRGVERFRLLHNLLSSQPMCFNLFGPLVDQPERSTRMARALLGDDVARVRRVAIEWAPAPAAEYLADATSFDASIDYERTDGARVLVAVETKLTDSFSQRRYDGTRYRRWMTSPRSPFRDPASREVATSRHNQLWRNHLLAIAARDRAASPYTEVRSALVLHPLDVDGASVVATYRDQLKPTDETFVVWTLDKVVDVFAAAATTPDELAWVTAFRTRYLALERSEHLYGRAR